MLNRAQPLSLGIFRSDYMVHENPSASQSEPEIKQVEFNTIASSFGGLSTKISALHRYDGDSHSLEHCIEHRSRHLLDISAYPSTIASVLQSRSLPANPSITSIAAGLQLAHQAYGSSKSSQPLSLCILFVVQDPENNVFDQYAISSHLRDRCRIPVFRLSFKNVLAETSLANENPSRPLIFRPPHAPHTPYEVTTLYLRAGYSPAEYMSASAWEARLHLEQSAAIKCPSILTHLAGSKKIQQIIATPSSFFLSKFLSGPPYEGYIERIRATFAAIYPLDDSVAGREAIRIAKNIEESRNYVLKPQREGGGNNVYGAKIPAFLASLGDDEKKYRGHILMELIEPPTLRNSIFRNGEIQSGEVIGELGVYGVCLWRNKSDKGGSGAILENTEAGFLLRTKGRESEEGGVAAGFGAVDSVCLVDV